MPADQIDEAAATAELFLAAELAARARAAKAGPVFTGRCLNCDADHMTDGQRWCDQDCRDDWDLRTK